MEADFQEGETELDLNDPFGKYLKGSIQGEVF